MSDDMPLEHPDLRALARRAMLDRGFLVETPEEAQLEVAAEAEPPFAALKIRDLSSWLWSSIDNDSSRDLDQIEYAMRESAGTRIFVAIADVDWFVRYRSELDRAAQHNTTSVYTGVLTFPMLPERLSTNLSSLNEGMKRLAIVVEILVNDDGHLAHSSVYPAIVENKAQLTYTAVASWLEGTQSNERASPASAGTLVKIDGSRELQNQLRLQDRVAAVLRKARHEAGALSLHTAEMEPVLSLEGLVIDLEARHQNRAGLLIEDLMIAANRATADFLGQTGLPLFRRVVKTPERWDRIVSLAASYGHDLPAAPDARRLEDFLQEQRISDPTHFPDVSLAIVKLLGRGEYLATLPGETVPGHFALAVNSYSHSTAPNRRFADLLTHRLIKAALAAVQSPYSKEELQALAVHCTERENAASKVERFVKKCAAAVVLAKHIGQIFDAVISGINKDGTWVRLSHPLVEGKLVGNTEHLDVGHRVRVRLVATDPEQGFIDFTVAKGENQAANPAGV